MARVGRSISTVIGVIVALGLVGLLVWAFIKGVEADPAVVGPIFAALIGLGVVAYQQTREKKQELERVHRDEMAPIYKTLVEMVKTIDEFVKRPEEELKTFYRDTSTTLLLHGPGPVVRAWVAWNRSLGVSPVSVPLRAQEQLLRAIRTDLGLDNSALQPGDLLRLYLNEEDDEDDRALWQELRSGK
jgi:hypothetical protein